MQETVGEQQRTLMEAGRARERTGVKVVEKPGRREAKVKTETEEKSAGGLGCVASSLAWTINSLSVALAFVCFATGGSVCLGPEPCNP